MRIEVEDYTVSLEDGELSFCLTKDIGKGRAAFAVMTGRGAVTTMRLLKPAMMQLVAQNGGSAYCDTDSRRGKMYRWLMAKAGISFQYEEGWNCTIIGE